jgi:hypothetical protein
VDTGSRKENESKQKTRASVLIQSEPIRLWAPNRVRPTAKGALPTATDFIIPKRLLNVEPFMMTRDGFAVRKKQASTPGA